MDNNTFVAYSLGNFFGDAERAGSNYSVVLNLEITKDPITKETKVTSYSYDPIFTEDGEDGLRVVRLEAAISAYEANFIRKISDEDYSDMVYAQKRIEQRIHGE